jgi:hypothetical protein
MERQFGDGRAIIAEQGGGVSLSDAMYSRGNLLLIHADSRCAVFAMYKVGDSPEVGI